MAVARHTEYVLYEDDVLVIDPSEVRRMYRQMVLTMTHGDFHTAIQDINIETYSSFLGTNQRHFQIPAGMNVFTWRRASHDDEVLMFGHLGNDDVCRMLYMHGERVWTFTDRADDLHVEHATFVQDFKDTVEFDDILLAIRDDKPARTAMSSYESDDGLESPRGPPPGGDRPTGASPLGGDRPGGASPQPTPTRGRGGAVSSFSVLRGGHGDGVAVGRGRGRGQGPARGGAVGRGDASGVGQGRAGAALTGEQAELEQIRIKQLEFCPILLTELQIHERKTCHCAWWIFPTTRYGKSEPGINTHVTPETAEQLVNAAPNSWQLCLEEIVRLAKAPLERQTRPRGLAAILPFVDLGRVQGFVEFWRVQPCCPPWLHAVCAALDTKVVDSFTGFGGADTNRATFGRISGGFGFEAVGEGGFSFGGIGSGGAASGKAESGGFGFGGTGGIISAPANWLQKPMPVPSFGAAAGAAAGGALGGAPGPLPGSFCMYNPMSFSAKPPAVKVRVVSIANSRVVGSRQYACVEVLSNKPISVWESDLTQIPDDALTPLEMSFRQPFRPSKVLRDAGIEGPVMDDAELRLKLKPETIMFPEYNEFSKPGKWGPTYNADLNEYVGGVDKGLLKKTGWVDSETIGGILLRMASEFGAVTFESTEEEVRRHFRKCKETNRETFLLLDGMQWLRGGGLLSPRESPFRDRINDNTLPPSGDAPIDLRYSPPPQTSKNPAIDLRYSPPPDTKASVRDKVVPDETHKVRITGKIFKFMDVSAFDNILMPIESGNHWILGRIRPKDHTSRIYDSLGLDRHRWLGFMNKFRDDVWKNKWLLKDRLISPVTGELLSDVEKANFEEMYKHEWVDDANYAKNFERQEDASACGVFVTTYIAYMLTRHEDKIITDVTHDNCVKVFRPWLARMLCEEAVPAAP